MNRPSLALSCVLAAISLAACDADSFDDSELTISQRAAFNRGDGNLSIHRGTSTSNAGDLIWDIVDDDVSSAGAGSAAMSGLLVSVNGDQIFDASGTLQCEVHFMGNDGTNLVQELRDGSDGEVLYTVRGKWVFYGSQGLGAPNFDELAFTIKGQQVYEGQHSDGVVLVTATEKIERASETRKLLIASLIDGTCGAPGLP